MSTQVSAALRRQAVKAARTRDQKLRHAISLYHLSPSFYPTSAASSSASTSTSASPSAQSGIDDAIDQTLHYDIWGSKDNQRDAGAKESVPTFYDGDYLVARLNQVTQAGPRDGSHEEPTVSPLLDWTSYEAGSMTRGSLAPQKSPREFAYDQLRRSFLSDGAGVTKLPKSPRPELRSDEPEQTHIQPGASAAVLRSQLDERSARIRDALFGTVGAGAKAGLEVVRERSAKHRQQE
ncbi:hypothetical protein BCV69DRAFT_102050 [Microstroma glucosiphilum]|uniref:Uncharacterized protein n=1 Tax=Pseudomicrostroma glucosiphilum TaxID=1684307 RepID=A0A316UCK5_9BASI|nr:hypothetical protein BCV69DRAFT_102050 [Pseudomicrostroma glucosiphilum]PWN22926.1 hypothetical protein BCV69DRAFT_102050 [Pseudomicrostroma glucosiphilum]